tara:strand:+ start:396 stop:545 length:150 start_codon:yes stop_codon:yes gene_type:complete
MKKKNRNQKKAKEEEAINLLSAMEPDAIVEAVAAKVNWKNQSANEIREE